VLSFGKKILSIPDTVHIFLDAMFSLTLVAVTLTDTILMHFAKYSTEQFKKLQGKR
jgi:hypothetical protein